MMSEQRFKKGDNLSCVDTETGKSYWYACNLCGLLNELFKENDNCKNDYRELFSNYVALEDENEQLKKENRQMAEKLFILNEKYGL